RPRAHDPSASRRTPRSRSGAALRAGKNPPTLFVATDRSGGRASVLESCRLAERPSWVQPPSGSPLIKSVPYPRIVEEAMPLLSNPDSMRICHSEHWLHPRGTEESLLF